MSAGFKKDGGGGGGGGGGCVAECNDNTDLCLTKDPLGGREGGGGGRGQGKWMKAAFSIQDNYEYPINLASILCGV